VVSDTKSCLEGIGEQGAGRREKQSINWELIVLLKTDFSMSLSNCVGSKCPLDISTKLRCIHQLSVSSYQFLVDSLK